MIGTVSSDKMQKSCTVRVERRYKHPKYGKYVVASKKYLVHDEGNEAREGDRVEISETRPLSKNKRWRLLSIIERAESAGEEATS
ncbi:MAG: 30S ribosomal protein S17 [Planctomycetota bacterium]|jgi:small subunit ribosomal protein S17